MKKMLFFVLCVVSVTAFSAPDKTSVIQAPYKRMDWTNTVTWGEAPPPTTFPSNNYVVEINGTVILNGNLTLPNNGDAIIVNDTLLITGDLIFSSNSNSVIDITIQNGGVLVVLGKVRSTDNNFDIRINSATGVLVSVNAVELGPTQISSQGDIYVVATPTGIDPGDFMASSPDQTVQDQNALLANQPDIFSFMVAYGFTPLPVELTSFSATSHDGGAFIDWSTASETNNDFFTIERSSDAVKWVGVAVVDGAGTSSLVHNYSYVDNNVPGGVTYYRIKQTDFDGNFSYSPVQSVKVTIPTTIIEFTTFPNPVSTLLYVESNFPVAKLTIYGADKRVVGVYETLPVDVSTLPPGVYTIVAEDTSARTTIQEFVKQ